ncbi:styrene monooxygenase/indole monooxygenase family protein [Nocardia callitridis]|uniref:Oxygenase n=1 Tax=Nocardia callitridis TaxID=648753 RepID=A0ABP9K1F3_9NOCA
MTSQNSDSRSPRSASVIGAGQTGVTAALGLLDAGFDVTLYSDRDQRGLRDDVPATGTALEFGEAQQAEAALGLDSFQTRAPRQTGLSVRFAGPGPENPELIQFDGNFKGFVGIAVDARLKADERLTAFKERGGNFVVQSVTPETLDTIAADSDLTLVATGKGGLSDLFAVDESRSPYAEPQRKLLTVTVRGLGYGKDVFAHRGPAGGRHSLFSIIDDQGEAWWGPYLHKDAGPAWSFIGWARPGSDWETRFAAADSAQSALRIVKDLYRDYLEWDLPEIQSTTNITEDPHSWLKGAVRPVVRSGVGHTASGHVVASLGDTSIAFDPVAGQGAQSGLIQAQRLAAAAAVHDGPFDEEWIAARYAELLAARGDAANKATSVFLRVPALAEIAGVAFTAGAVHQGVADAVVSLLHFPQALNGVESLEDLHALIGQITGEDAADVLARFTPAGKFERSSYAGPEATS